MSDRLLEIRARLDASTPRPWIVFPTKPDPNLFWPWIVRRDQPNAFGLIMDLSDRDGTDPGGLDYAHGAIGSIETTGGHDAEQVLADAELIAHAPEDISHLLGEVERLSAQVQRVRAIHQPVEIEPSETICGECSFRIPNGRYFGKVVEWPCPTLIALDDDTRED